MARERPQPALIPLPFSGRGSIAPALVVLVGLVVAGLGYTLGQSVGLLAVAGDGGLSLAPYADLLGGESAPDLWRSLAFTLWVSGAATILAAAAAIAIVVWLDRPTGTHLHAGALHVNLAIPHAVWAVALMLLLSQSGILSRASAGLGITGSPTDFPVLVGDRYGVGLIIHYATKEAPFLALLALAIWRAQPQELTRIAASLGAGRWQRARLLIIPTVAPAVAAASALVLAFIVGAAEAPAILGASTPRMLSLVSLDLFNSPDLTRRPAAMALGMLMSALTLVMVWVMLRITLRRVPR